MRKGISPLVASVLLIAITMAVAAILANYVSTSVKEQTEQFQATCIGASINYVTAIYPKYSNTTGRITAVVEAQYAALGSFKFDLIFQNDTAMTLDMFSQPANGLPAGGTGTIESTSIGVINPAVVKQVRVSTNCSNVKTDWSSLKT